MHYTVLGRTGLNVSVLGIGGGGYSKLGNTGKPGEDNGYSIIRKAIDNGVNIFDTAEGYGTENIIGKAVQESGAHNIVLCSKAGVGSPQHPRPVKDFVLAVENSLRQLRTDTIDLYQFHGIRKESYQRVADEYVPALIKLREKGSVRFFGITEAFEVDTTHAMLQLALQDDCWDTFMVGYNIFNFSARQSIFPLSRKKNIGILAMFAVRFGLVNPANFERVLSGMIDRQELTSEDVARSGLPGSLLTGAASLPDAAYRFCRHDPDINVVLCGTGSSQHLEANLNSITSPALTGEVLSRIQKLFDGIDSESAKSPDLCC
jgi:aryl-alcohol dehydrogenase-like predicted oxidoreductase